MAAKKSAYPSFLWTNKIFLGALWGAFEDELEPVFNDEAVRRFEVPEACLFRQFRDLGIICPRYGGPRCPICGRIIAEDEKHDEQRYFTCANGHAPFKMCFLEQHIIDYKVSFSRLHEVISNRMALHLWGRSADDLARTKEKAIDMGFVERYGIHMPVYYVRGLSHPSVNVLRCVRALQAKPPKPTIVISPSYSAKRVAEKEALRQSVVEILSLKDVVCGYGGFFPFRELDRETFVILDKKPGDFQVDCEISIRETEEGKGAVVITPHDKKPISLELDRTEIRVLLVLARKMLRHAKASMANSQKGWTTIRQLKSGFPSRNSISDSAIRSYLSKIRSRLPAGLQPIIENMRNGGYRLSVHPARIRVE